MVTATVSAKGWIVIPKEIRQRYHLKKGDKVHVIDTGRTLTIVPVSRDPIAEGRGMLKGGPPSLTQSLLEDRRWELEQEERDLPPPPPKP